MGDIPISIHLRLQVFKVLQKFPFEFRDFLRNELHIGEYVANKLHAKKHYIHEIMKYE